MSNGLSAATIRCGHELAIKISFLSTLSSFLSIRLCLESGSPGFQYHDPAAKSGDCRAPAKDIRRFLREIFHLQVSCGYAQHILGCPKEEAKQVMRALEKEGYLSRAGRHEGHDLYETTLKGNQLAGANLRPISRTTAEKTLKAFMQRVRAVNADPDYLETITGVIVFGSFLSASEELGVCRPAPMHHDTPPRCKRQ